jgi:hypothetical protein
MSALCKAHPHHRVAGLDQAEECRLVRLRAGIGLDIGVLGAANCPIASIANCSTTRGPQRLPG